MKQQLKHQRPFLALLAVSAGLALAPPASATTVDEHESSGEPAEEDVGDNVLTLKLAGLEIVVPSTGEVGSITGEVPEGEGEGDRVLRRVGVEIGLERVLLPGWLEVELSVLIAPGTGGLTLPIDLVLKKPFELSPRLEGFIGLGLATEWYEAGEQATAYGAASQLGAYYWLEPHFGLAFEGEYNLLLHPETAHEFVLASGAAFRF
jgi:hypothetical protein